MSSRTLAALIALWTGAVLVLLLNVGRLDGQSLAAQVLTVPRGTSALVNSPARIERVSIGDPEIADAVAVSPTEVLVNARKLGTTSLIVWTATGARLLYTVEVTVDAATLERQLRTLFPSEPISVTASGNLLIVSGRVTDAGVARRALDITRGTGATVIDNLAVPPARQILLEVRFAEVTRTAGMQLGSSIVAGETGVNLFPDVLSGNGDRVIETLSDGLIQLFLMEDGVQVSAVIEALQERGIFRSLAEPNLLALEGQEASFLAGGEFPIPVPQGGQSNLITVIFKEFGVRLRFTPTVTIAGNIRLQVAPEVSSLNFPEGLQFSGFRIPSLITRRAETTVELRDGQTFAIGGLMNSTINNNTSQIPILGDIPILGALFRSKDNQQARTELLVLVTPRVVQPLDAAPPVPTGEPATWNWSRSLRRPTAAPAPRAPAQP